jgi:hypothetical protein
MDFGKLNSTLTKIRDVFIHVMNNNLSPKIKNLDYLYHYTNIDSFMSIMENNELWFSHTSFLNDPLEISFGIDVITNILEKNHNDFSIVINIIEKQRKLYKENSLDLTRDLVFLFSFSGLPDELSSWVQYGDSGYGICLDFVQSKLLENISAHSKTLKPVMFFPVQYYSSWYSPDSNNISGFSNALIDYYTGIEEFITKEGMEKESNVQRALYEITKSFACFIKNDFHAREKEWRYVIFTGKGDENIKIIPANHGAKMFFKVNFGNFRIIELINRITIGPKHNKDQRISAALELLLFQKYRTIFNIHFSDGILQ